MPHTLGITICTYRISSPPMRLGIYLKMRWWKSSAMEHFAGFGIPTPLLVSSEGHSVQSTQEWDHWKRILTDWLVEHQEIALCNPLASFEAMATVFPQQLLYPFNLEPASTPDLCRLDGDKVAQQLLCNSVEEIALCNPLASCGVALERQMWNLGGIPTTLFWLLNLTDTLWTQRYILNGNKDCYKMPIIYTNINM